jgi:hypothetical protein
MKGYGLSIDLNPSPVSHLTMLATLSHKGRGKNERSSLLL